MADITPPSPGGLPPKPNEPAKVQPKKETVRINLPPKPTSAPTIKLPTLAPGAPPPSMPTAAAAPAAPAARPPSSPTAAPAATPAPRASAPASSVAQRPPAAPMPRPVVVAAVGLTTVDKVLAICAAVAALAGLAGLIYLKFGMPDSGVS